jgi:hypothetical protein
VRLDVVHDAGGHGLGGTKLWKALQDGGGVDSAKATAASSAGSKVFVTGSSDELLVRERTTPLSPMEQHMRRWLDQRSQGGMGRRQYFAVTCWPCPADVDAMVGDHESANGIALETDG